MLETLAINFSFCVDGKDQESIDEGINQLARSFGFNIMTPIAKEMSFSAEVVAIGVKPEELLKCLRQQSRGELKKYFKSAADSGSIRLKESSIVLYKTEHLKY